MRLSVLFLIIFSLPIVASDKIDKLIKMSSPDCQIEVTKFNDEIKKDFPIHIKRMALDKIDALLKIRIVIIDEGAIKSQEKFDELLALELSALFFNNEILEEQRGSITRIKEILLTYPLKVSEWHLTNLKNNLEAFGI